MKARFAIAALCALLLVAVGPVYGQDEDTSELLGELDAASGRQELQQELVMFLPLANMFHGRACAFVCPARQGFPGANRAERST